MKAQRATKYCLLLPLVAAMAVVSYADVGPTEVAYPTGDRATSVILLERLTPAEVRAGEDYSYTVKLTNLARVPIEGLVLTEEIAAGLDVSDITPKPDRREGHKAVWDLGTLGAREAWSAKISGQSSGTGELKSCAQITFSMGACSTTKVVQPELELVKTAPAEVLVCDPIPLRFVVTNAGSGVARNVVITDRLPAGWTAGDGGNELRFDAGDLAAGQSREFSASVKSSETGEFTNTARAEEAGGLSAEASASTAVRKPTLVVTKTGPKFRYIGRPAKFEITVANEGDAPARNTVLVDTLPAGVKFAKASDNGQFSSGQVTWNLGTLDAGAERTVSVTITPTRADKLRNEAVARAYCAEGSGAAPLEVKGIPAILLEVIDIHDPIEVGSQETYEITVVNQGSADGTNIAITCTLPTEQDYVSTSGPTDASVSGKTVKFAPLRSLAPKAKVVYRVVIKGTAVGDVRFKVSMTSDQVNSPVTETESTNIY